MGEGDGESEVRVGTGGVLVTRCGVSTRGGVVAVELGTM